MLTGETVRSWSAADGCVRVTTDKQTYEAAKIVIAAGAWSGPLLHELSLPLVVLRKLLFWHDVSTTQWCDATAFFFERPSGCFYGFPSLDGQTVKLAEHTGGEPVDTNGCPLYGACCTPTGSSCLDFTFVDLAFCDSTEGVYQGNGSNCGDGCALGVAGDFDGDGDVDWDDYISFEECISGPAEGTLIVIPTAQCRIVFDFDDDRDVDVVDYAAFQTAWTGSIP